MRREYYRFFRSRDGFRPKRTPVLPEKFAKIADRNFGQFAGLKAHPRTFERLATAIADRLGAVHPWGRCESRLVRGVQLWLHDRADSPETVRRYLACIARFIRASGLRRLDLHAQVSPRYLAGYRDHLQAQGLAPRTINTALQILRSWFTWMHRLGLIRIHPYRRELLVQVDQGRLYHPNRAAGVRRALGLDQAKALVAWARAQRPEVEAGIGLLLGAGLRNAEVRSARWEQLHQDGGKPALAVTGKGQRTRTVALDPVAVVALDRLRAKRGRPPAQGLILHHQLDPISDDTLNRWVAQGGEAIGRPDLTPHELRRTHATLMRDAGASLEAAQLALGHASAETTRRSYDVGDRRFTESLGIDPKGAA